MVVINSEDAGDGDDGMIGIVQKFGDVARGPLEIKLAKEIHKISKHICKL